MDRNASNKISNIDLNEYSEKNFSHIFKPPPIPNSLPFDPSLSSNIPRQRPRPPPPPPTNPLSLVHKINDLNFDKQNEDIKQDLDAQGVQINDPINAESGDK